MIFYSDIEMNEPNTISKFQYNPFSGVTMEDIERIIVPHFEIDTILNTLQSETPMHIEFLGRQGRGKTTHLKWLSNRISEVPLYLLNHKSKLTELLEDNSDILLIDSIHHIPLAKRIKLFRSKKHIVFTTHISRKLECLFVKRNIQTIKFKGIEEEILKSILNRRLSLAAISPLNSEDLISDDEVSALIIKHKDNYRGIINQLYDKYQL